MKHWPTAAVVLLFAVCASAGIVSPELVPGDRDFRSYGHLRAYHLAVRDALLGAALHGGVEALVLPSFEREWSVHFGRRTTDGVDVVCSVMKKSLWEEMERAAQSADGTITPEAERAALVRIPKDVYRLSARLPTPVADQLERVWAVMLARATQPADSAFGLDGTTYYLFRWTPEGKYQAGSSWSPEKGTNAADLVAIVEELRQYAGASGPSLAHSESALVARASKLLAAARGNGLSNNRTKRTITPRAACGVACSPFGEHRVPAAFSVCWAGDTQHLMSRPGC